MKRWLCHVAHGIHFIQSDHQLEEDHGVWVKAALKYSMRFNELLELRKLEVLEPVRTVVCVLLVHVWPSSCAIHATVAPCVANPVCFVAVVDRHCVLNARFRRAWQVLSLMHAQRAYFHQGYDELHNMQPDVETISHSLQNARHVFMERCERAAKLASEVRLH